MDESRKAPREIDHDAVVNELFNGEREESYAKPISQLNRHKAQAVHVTDAGANCEANKLEKKLDFVNQLPGTASTPIIEEVRDVIVMSRQPPRYRPSNQSIPEFFVLPARRLRQAWPNEEAEIFRAEENYQVPLKITWNMLDGNDLDPWDHQFEAM